ncbi:penicillin-binding protein activator [Cellvibrio sp. QJXJ]|jgi:outer membrane PBP1 activator LpoA protein|uniref:penicillin-binding protein activator n=1 Tax=Cellvibrio sp. QJXJ TaxID=2964606 RepID=UPI0021C3F6CC|nr:penicillin-binding protein activator [Cellvibrio sp. QJXJ]UUA72348.1 penicillin-binding protein activator [Cellvibrio sp. QJXJ]
MPKRLFMRSFSHQVAISKLLVPVLTATLLGLSGCSSTPTQTTSKPTTQTQPAQLSASKLLQMANQAQSPERESLVLQAAQVYIASGKYNRARNLLVDMNTDNLPDQAYIKHTDLLSAVALQEGSNFLAHGILTKPRLEQQWQAMEPAMEISLRDKRAQVFALLGEPQNSVSERIQIAALSSDKKLLQANQDALWQSLMSIPFTELQQLSLSGMSDTARGWYSLAAINKNNQIDLEQQREQLQVWLRDWRQHPAHNNLPSDLKLLQSLIEQQPKQIALLLPMQGKLAEAGEAVRDGFFAAYFQAVSNRRHTPEVRQYDSSGDVIAAYQQAIAEGADLVIGPIDKEKVTELSLMPSLDVPVLSLNYPDTPPAQPLKGFYQFGLAVEDEARQVARQAFLEGHRQAMVIIPSQEWSERSARAFANEWEKLGGVVVNRSQFQSGANYSKLVKDAMQIESSLVRNREMQELLGIPLQTSPRSRSDVDMIFLIADPAQGRQIKPTFAFHYAGNIPVYATSQIYSGQPNPRADRDLNGVRFNTMPWLFDTSSPEKQSVAQHTKSAAVYGRLHALGADAFRLYARLPQLEQVPDMRIFGATGALHMLEDGRIEREQIWVRFRNGEAQPLPMVINQNELQY